MKGDYTTDKTNHTRGKEAESPVQQAINRAQQHLLSIQNPEGYWWGELESNPTMEAVNRDM